MPATGRASIAWETEAKIWPASAAVSLLRLRPAAVAVAWSSDSSSEASERSIAAPPPWTIAVARLTEEVHAERRIRRCARLAAEQAHDQVRHRDDPGILGEDGGAGGTAAEGFAEIILPGHVERRWQAQRLIDERSGGRLRQVRVDRDRVVEERRERVDLRGVERGGQDERIRQSRGDVGPPEGHDQPPVAPGGIARLKLPFADVIASESPGMYTPVPVGSKNTKAPATSPKPKWLRTDRPYLRPNRRRRLMADHALLSVLVTVVYTPVAPFAACFSAWARADAVLSNDLAHIVHDHVGGAGAEADGDVPREIDLEADVLAVFVDPELGVALAALDILRVDRDVEAHAGAETQYHRRD